MMNQSRNGLQADAANCHNPNNRMVRLDILLSLRHPNPHSQRRECHCPPHELPRRVQPDREAERQHADDDAAAGEDEAEGEAAKDAVGALDARLEAGGGEFGGYGLRDGFPGSEIVVVVE